MAGFSTSPGAHAITTSGRPWILCGFLPGHCLDTAIISFFCILTDEGLRSETSESNSVRNVLLRQCSKNSLSITNAVMSLYDIINPITKVTKVTPRVDLLPILKYKTNKQSDPPPPPPPPPKYSYSSDNHYGGWIIVFENVILLWNHSLSPGTECSFFSRTSPPTSITSAPHNQSCWCLCLAGRFEGSSLSSR